MSLRTLFLLVPCAAVLLPGCSDKVDVDEVSTKGRTLPEMAPISVASNDWPWWRGPARNAQAVGDSYPTEWSSGNSIVWKAKIPGRGHASPTVVGDSVYVATADEARKLQSVLCYDRGTGDLRWRKDLHQGGLGKLNHAHTTFASSTIGSDGQRVFVVFRNEGQIVVSALDSSGDLLWQKTLGGHSTSFGFGSSPVIYKQLVIVTADSESGGFLAALNRKTGDVWWLKKRHAADDYSSAVVGHVAGKDQLLLVGGGRVMGYDPMTGDELWTANAYAGTTCGTIVWKDDVVFVNSGYGGRETVAVKADGSNEVVWKKSGLNFYVPSMLLHEDHIYAVTNSGIAYCLSAADGTVAWQHRLGGNTYASPIFAAGNIYVADRGGKTTVFKANPARFEQVATNRLGNAVNATPVACGGRLYLRVTDRSAGEPQEWLYCIGQ